MQKYIIFDNFAYYFCQDIHPMKPEYAKYYKHPRLVLAKLLQYASPLFPDDKQYLTLLYRLKIGERLDWDHPQSYTAKLQWMKLYYRNPILSHFIDKFEVKVEVAKRVGVEHVIPTYGVWNRAEDIDFDALPDKFVLKGTHDCHSVIICRDKQSFDVDGAREKLSLALKRNNYLQMREWAYKMVKPRIIAEALIEDPAHPEELTDYKFFCFDGKVKALYVAMGRNQKDIRFDFFDRDFNHLPLFNEHPHSETLPAKPDNYAQMREIAETLSAGFPHVRIDLYSLSDGRILFGEYTFYPGGGMNQFEPREWDYTIGSWFTLPEPYAESSSK